MAVAAPGADDKRRGLALREGFRAHIDAVIRRPLGGEIDHLTAVDGLRGNRDQASRGVGLAGLRFRTDTIVDDREVGRVRVFGDLNPYRGARGIIGEGDMHAGGPEQRRQLDRGVAEGDAGMRDRSDLAAGKHRGPQQGNNRGQDLETQHDTLLARPGTGTDGPYGLQSVKETRYRRVDAGIGG